MDGSNGFKRDIFQGAPLNTVKAGNKNTVYEALSLSGGLIYQGYLGKRSGGNPIRHWLVICARIQRYCDNGDASWVYLCTAF